MIFENNDRIIFAGDSVTDMGSAQPVGEGLFENLGRSYVRVIENLLATCYPELFIRITNSGTSGNTSRDLLARFDRDVVSLSPDWVSICIGINDVWRQFDSPAIPDSHVLPDEYEKNLEEMILKIKDKVKGVFILSPYIMEPNTDDMMRKRMDEYVEINEKLAKKHNCYFLNLQKMYEDYCKIRHSSYIAWDRIHPNQIGATLMAREFLKLCGFDYNRWASAEENTVKYFEKYTSNSCAGSGNQLFFNMEEGEIRTGRIFYKIFAGGEYSYSLLFSNILDSTYADGAVSHKNLICGGWKIHNAKIGKCERIPSDKDVSEMTLADGEENKAADIIVSDFKRLTFDGKAEKEVMPGEFFSSDPVTLSFGKGEYLCLEITFSGKMIPYHEESILPVYVKENGTWKYGRRMPFASMIGCDRAVKGRIAYIGDSITQGIGTPYNSYLHWNAILAEKIGDGYSHWNLGIGYARANDAASDGAWLYKAKQNDVVFVCFGVNDIMQNQSEEQVKADLFAILKRLKEAGVKVVLQTVPPFNYTGEKIAVWENVNAYIKTELCPIADALFDNVPCLGNNEKPYNSVFGPHPNDVGCKAWAEALFDALRAYPDLL